MSTGKLQTQRPQFRSRTGHSSACLQSQWWVSEHRGTRDVLTAFLVKSGRDPASNNKMWHE